MSTAVTVEPVGSTQQLHWVAKELAVIGLWFGLAAIRHDNVCFVWYCAYVYTWFPNNHNRGGDRWTKWPSLALNCYEYRGLWVSFNWCFIYTASEKSTDSHFFGSSAEAPDLKQEERLQELESCSGVGSTSDDTEVREVSSRPSTPGLSVVSGINLHTLTPTYYFACLCFVSLHVIKKQV